MIITNAGLVALTVEAERVELQAVTKRKPVVKLQYLTRSKECGLRLWNVLGQVEGYPPCGGANGYPTFSLDTLRARGIV